MRLWLFFLPICAAAGATLLSEAEEISQMYSREIAKASPPSRFPLAENCLQLSSVWFSVDLQHLKTGESEKPLDLFSSEKIWQILKEIGFDGVQFGNLREEGKLSVNPKWGGDWTRVEMNAQKKSVSLIGDLIGNSMAPGADFQEAIRNVGEYPNLFQLVEIDPADWKLLPRVPSNAQEANIPWLSIQELHKRGYVPEKFSPWIKESDWNATAKVVGKDGKTRRWIYLKEGKNNPVFAWLSPSFAAYRLAAGDALEGAFRLGQRIFQIDGAIPSIAEEMLSLWVRKIGAYSAATTDGTLDSIKKTSADLALDTATRPALLHALIAEDAEALRMIYRIFLEEGIEAKRLVHVLQPFDKYVCDWIELMKQPKKTYKYRDEQITGELLLRRLLKDDLFRLGSKENIPLTTWVDYCAKSIGIKDFDSHKEEISSAHLFLAFAYAMQPGAFSLSAADLLGALPNQTGSLDLMGASSGTLYASLPVQMKNSRSFAARLKAILAARRESNIAAGELIAVPNSARPSTLLLVHRLPGSRFIQLLALNFGRKESVESIEMPEIRQTSAIDLMSNLAEEKVFASGSFSFILPPLSGRAFYFQPKYYD